jgi:hypothetical protein
MSKLIKVTCASRKEKSQTIRTNQFSGLTFTKGDRYVIKPKGINFFIPCYVNRKDGSTLYIKKDNWPRILNRAMIGQGNERILNVEYIAKELKGT